MEKLLYKDARLAEYNVVNKPKSSAVVEHPQEIIFAARSIFPLDIVPNRIMIDQHKIVILYRDILGATTEHTILLNEVHDVDVELTYFVGNLRILGSGPGTSWTSITNLHKSAALQAKYVIEGLLIARNEHYDLSKLEPSELLRELTILGDWDHREMSRRS